MVPLTFLYEFNGTPDDHIPYVLREFADAGAKNLVLSDYFISRIFQNYGFADTLNKYMDDAGMKFVDAHAMFGPRLDLNAPDPADRRVLVQRNLMTLEILAMMKVDTITVHVGNNHWMEEKLRDLDLNIRLIEDSLSQILPTAEKLGITVCIENIWFPTNTPEVLLGIKEHFPTDALGFCYDAGHANLCAKGHLYPDGGSYGNAWRIIYGTKPVPDDKICEKMLPHIVNCHLHDNNGQGDQHFCPGNGNVDWQHIAGLLRQAPRLKNIQSEVIVPNRALVSIRKLCDTFRRIFPECWEN